MILQDLISNYGFIILLFVFSGILAGLMSGLFGIGGGMVLVPALSMGLNMLGFDDLSSLKQATSTSLALIIFSSFMSAKAQFKRKSLDIDVFKKWGISIAFGVFSGAIIGEYVPPYYLYLLFSIITLFLSLNMLMELAKPLIKWEDVNAILHIIIPFIIGIISSWLGVAGGALMLPIFILFGLPLQRAIGTSSALGVIVASIGTIMAIYMGWSVPNRIPFSLGYVSLIAFIFILPFISIMAPVGVRISHKIPPKILKKLFAIYLIIVCIHMFRKFLITII